MKKLIVALSVILALFTLTLLPRNNTAYAQQIKDVIVSNFPEIFNTQEQNVDENGNIKVHEQGTVSVNLVNNSSEWEYATDCFSNWNTYFNGLPQRLNDRASNGWELVSTLQFQEQLACEYWKRVK